MATFARRATLTFYSRSSWTGQRGSWRLASTQVSSYAPELRNYQPLPHLFSQPPASSSLFLIRDPFTMPQSLKLSNIELPPLPSNLALPPLPDLEDDLAAVTFTHSSLIGKPHRPTALDGEPSMDWEKLEFIGDGILGGAVSTLVHRLFPGQPPGTSTVLKSLLVRNSLLAEVSIRYGMPSRIRAPAESQYLVRASVKSQASVFEAYIGAIYHGTLDNYLRPPEHLSTNEVVDWLYQVFTPIALFAEQHLRDQVAKINAESGHNVDEDAEGCAAYLNTWVSVRNGKRHRNSNGPPTVKYKDSAVGTDQISLMWSVECTFFDGNTTHVAEAVRSTKANAKNVAAWKVCEQAGISAKSTV